MYENTVQLALLISQTTPPNGAHIKVQLLIEEARIIARKYNGKPLREVDEYKPTLFRELSKFVENVSGFITADDVALDASHTQIEARGGSVKL